MRTKLAAAREHLGWSQARLMSEMQRRGRATGLVVMSTPSLRTALSRWENGHITPDRDHRQLLRDIYGLTDAELGFSPAAVVADEQELATGPTTDLRRDIDQLLGADAATCVTGLEERVSLQAQDCVRIAPSAMLTRCFLTSRTSVPLEATCWNALVMRLYEVAADLSVGRDELMVLGRPADSQAWVHDGQAAAGRTDSPRIRARR